jgi:soluble lytic murein transglycosylase-like protein
MLFNVVSAQNITQSREQAWQIFRNINNNNCNQYIQQLNNINDTSLREATRWMIATKAKKCINIKDFIRLFKYYHLADFIIEPMIDDSLNFITFAIENKQPKDDIKQLLEYIISNFEKLKPYQSIRIAKLMSQVFNAEDKIFVEYINKTWSQATFNLSQWNIFFKQYRNILTQHDHYISIKRIIANEEYNINKDTIDFITDVNIRSTLYDAIKIGKTNNISQIPHIVLNTDCEDILHIVAANKMKHSSPDIRYQIANQINTSFDDNISWKILLNVARNLILMRPTGYEDMVYNLISKKLHLSTENIIDQQMLCGWWALRFVHNPQLAIDHLKTIRSIVKSPTVKAKLNYWLGRAYNDQGKEEKALNYFTIAAQNPFVFFGQLAVAESLQHLNNTIKSKLAKLATQQLQCHEYSADLFIELGNFVNKNGNFWRAAAFFEEYLNKTPQPDICHLQEIINISGDTASCYFGRLGAKMGIPIPQFSFPKTTHSNNPLVNAIIRQESKFRSSTTSNKGAKGLMQVKDSTAKWIAQQTKTNFTSSKMYNDNYNVKVGEYYMQHLIKKFNSSIIAIASYNAGEGNVRRWTKTMGKPSGDDLYDTLDWIESIPYKETRHYVFNIIESHIVYSAIHREN